MPSSICDPSPTYVAKDRGNAFFKPSERRRNENRPAVRDRQKRPDKQIYVPRALRESQKCISVENKIETEIETNSVQENNQAIADKHGLCSKSQKEKHIETVNLETNIEKEGQTNTEKIVADCTNFENEEVNNSSSLLSGMVCENSQIASSSSHTFEINVLHNQESKKITVFPQKIVYDEHSLPLSDNSSLPLQDSASQNPDNSCISENIQENSDESLLDNSHREYKNEAITRKKSGEYPHLENEDSWESKFDDDGECLNPEFLKELKNVTGQIKVLVAKKNYRDFQPATDNVGAGSDTIVELYDFPREFSTQDLVSAFSQFQQSSYSIKWVDDCHALAIFSSPAIANQALILNHPFVKVRPIAEGIKESKEKARSCEPYCEPTKPRPTTSAVLARRLVSGALGLKVRATKEQRDQERSILNDAKEKRRLKAKQKQAIWDGKVL